MNRWNRLLIMLVALLVLAGAVVIVLVATEAVEPDLLPGGSESDPSGAWFYSQLLGVAGFSGSEQAITIVVSVAVGVAMLGLLFLEIRPALQRPSRLQISSTPDGVLNIEEDSVRLLAERTGIANRNISSVRCRVSVRRRPAGGGPASVVIDCYPRLILGSSVPEVRDDLQTRVRDTVERFTGLTVLRVNVIRVHYERGDGPRLMGA